MDYSVENTGYNAIQESRGYMELHMGELNRPVYIDVVEVTSPSNHKVHMIINFNGQSKLHKALTSDIIECENVSNDDPDLYEITDQVLITNLFMEYGNNA